MMTTARRDLIATVAVGVAALVYLLWLAAAPIGVRVVAAAVLGLGFVASATAVVPAFTQLLHSSTLYLAAASVLGLLAAVAGVWALATGSPGMLTVLMVATVALWAMATVRHRRVVSGRRS